MVDQKKIVCWRCGESLSALPLPFSRTAECPSCNADLTICKMCRWFDPRVTKQCREPVAEIVQNKERANFCGYFEVKEAAFTSPDVTSTSQAKKQLDELFGGSTSSGPDSTSSTDALDALFKKK